MNRDEFENEVITLLKPGPMAQMLVQVGVPVTSMEIGRHRPNPAALLSLIRHLRAKKPAILQTWLYHADFFGAVAAFFARPEHLLKNGKSAQQNRPPRHPQIDAVSGAIIGDAVETTGRNRH